MKFAALKTAIKDKRIAIVDDSLVRGTTTKHLISFLRENGAREVHVRLASPPVKFGCCYGVNASSETELPASTKTTEEIREMIGGKDPVPEGGTANAVCAGKNGVQRCCGSHMH